MRDVRRSIWNHLNRDESGFTLVEVLATMLVLTVGLLGMLPLIDTGNQTTAKNLNRETANNIARQLIESAHAEPYSQLTTRGSSNAADTLRNAIDPAPHSRNSTDPSSTSHVWTMDGRTAASSSRMTVTLDSCVVAPKSAGYVVDQTKNDFCAAPSGGSGPPGTTVPIGTAGGCQGQVSGDQTLGLRVAVVNLSLCVDSQLIDLVCKTLGPGAQLGGVLSALVGPSGSANLQLGGVGLDLQLCGGTTTAPPSTPPTPPLAARRITATVQWGSGSKTHTVKNVTLVPEPSPS